jgi:hypothetical protein
LEDESLEFLDQRPLKPTVNTIGSLTS